MEDFSVDDRIESTLTQVENLSPEKYIMEVQAAIKAGKYKGNMTYNFYVEIPVYWKEKQRYSEVERQIMYFLNDLLLHLHRKMGTYTDVIMYPCNPYGEKYFKATFGASIQICIDNNSLRYVDLFKKWCEESSRRVEGYQQAIGMMHRLGLV